MGSFLVFAANPKPETGSIVPPRHQKSASPWGVLASSAFRRLRSPVSICATGIWCSSGRGDLPWFVFSGLPVGQMATGYQKKTGLVKTKIDQNL